MTQTDFAHLISRHIQENGAIESGIPGVQLLRWDQPIPCQTVAYEPGVVILGNGHKRVYINGQSIDYNPNQYLVISVPLPMECDATASPEDPLLGIRINVDLTVLHEMASLMGVGAERTQADSGPQQAVQSAHLSNEMRDAVIRLLKCLDRDADKKVLGPGLAREVLYRVLSDDGAAPLLALMEFNGHMTRVARSLNFIHENLNRSLSVEDLAKEAHMSVSAFHRSFKDITGDSPIQYIKRVRLSTARHMIVEQGGRVNAVAHRVGYESPSQFSREFKRLYGMTPKEAAAAMTQSQAAE